MGTKKAVKTSKQRVGGAKKKASKTPEPEPEQKAEAVTLFEFYKIFPRDFLRTRFETELCNPPCQRVSKINLQTALATACAESYGEGYFIALEVGGVSEGQAQGLALAYWLIRVKPNKHGIPCRRAEQIALSDEDHEHLNILKWLPAGTQPSKEDEQRERELGAPENETGKVIEIKGRPYVVDHDELVKLDHEHSRSYHKNPALEALRNYKDSDEWRRLFDPDVTQRRVCAEQMATKYFDLMPDPQVGERMKPHDYVRLRMAQGAQQAEIIDELTYNKGPFQLPPKDAQTKWDSVQRGNQMKAKKEREKEQGQATIPTPATKKKAKK